MTDSVLRDFFDCWKQESINGTRPWPLTLPVVECSGGTISNCSKFIGTITVNIMWVKYKDTTQPYYPTAMAAAPPYDFPWDSPDPGNAVASWESFANYFNFKTDDNELFPLEKKAIYYLPEDCHLHEPPPTPVYNYSCFIGHAADSMADCAILDSVYIREGIGNAFWNDNYICNQQSLQCE
jgi:hypothetical protein